MRRVEFLTTSLFNAEPVCEKSFFFLKSDIYNSDIAWTYKNVCVSMCRFCPNLSILTKDKQNFKFLEWVWNALDLLFISLS